MGLFDKLISVAGDIVGDSKNVDAAIKAFSDVVKNAIDDDGEGKKKASDIESLAKKAMDVRAEKKVEEPEIKAKDVKEAEPENSEAEVTIKKVKVKCENCGEKISETKKICPHCGTKRKVQSKIQ